ncbi:toxin-antitoxin system YwqK family antitoxin, partial [Shewanella xiamenensis]|uniref:toxin-antitoxin system YwqK family antitoxin n=1 Tax=Shewanella xiamenensis TaxID=332186 RepID=UPI0035BB09B4
VRLRLELIDVVIKKSSLCQRISGRDNLNKEGEYKAGLKEGLWVQYASGLKQKEQTFVNGKLNGDYAEYYQGRRRITGQYEDNQKTGLWIDYRYEAKDPTYGAIPEGNISQKTHWKDNKRHGTSEYYSFKQVVYRLETYDNNDKTGSYAEYYPNNGQLKLSGTMDKGLQTGLWESWYEDGILAASSEFLDNQQHGSSKGYYSNGQLKLEAQYTKGELDGERREYHQNGNPKLSETWLKGQKEGEASYYHVNGKLAEQGSYLKDRREGLWQQFWPNGEKRSEGSYIADRQAGDWNHYDQLGKLINTEHF